MLMFLISFLLIKFKYKINEENHASMIKAIDARYKGEEYRDENLDKLDLETAKKPRKIKKKEKKTYKETFREQVRDIIQDIHNKKD